MYSIYMFPACYQERGFSSCLTISQVHKESCLRRTQKAIQEMSDIFCHFLWKMCNEVVDPWPLSISPGFLILSGFTSHKEPSAFCACFEEENTTLIICCRLHLVGSSGNDVNGLTTKICGLCQSILSMELIQFAFLLMKTPYNQELLLKHNNHWQQEATLLVYVRQTGILLCLKWDFTKLTC